MLGLNFETRICLLQRATGSSYMLTPSHRTVTPQKGVGGTRALAHFISLEFQVLVLAPFEGEGPKRLYALILVVLFL